MTRRPAPVLLTVAAGLALLGGCAPTRAETTCVRGICALSFERGGPPSVTVLGRDVTLIGADDATATVDIAGQQKVLAVGAEPVDLGGLQAAVQNLTDQRVSLLVSRPPDD